MEAGSVSLARDGKQKTVAKNGPSDGLDDIPGGTGSRQKPAGGLHKMDVLGGGASTVDLELIEELIAGTASEANDVQMHGLQQFRAESTSKVVHMKAASLRKADGGSGGGSSAVVLAGGVGWGLPSGGDQGSGLSLPPVVPESKAEVQQVSQSLRSQGVSNSRLKETRNQRNVKK